MEKRQTVVYKGKNKKIAGFTEMFADDKSEETQTKILGLLG